MSFHEGLQDPKQDGVDLVIHFLENKEKWDGVDGGLYLFHLTLLERDLCFDCKGDEVLHTENTGVIQIVESDYQTHSLLLALHIQHKSLD